MEETQNILKQLDEDIEEIREKLKTTKNDSDKSILHNELLLRLNQREILEKELIE
jgi:hypothetical protein